MVLAVLGALAACRASPAPEVAPPLLTRAQAEARTVVPFTRAVQLQKAGRIAEVTFDLPAPQKPAIPILNIGLRLQDTDARRLLDAWEKIRLGRPPMQLRPSGLMAAHLILYSYGRALLTGATHREFQKMKLCDTCPIQAWMRAH